ncbi:hypothetical protein VTI74DRAFT_8745 [Chaetomium olivicolor]
MTPISLPFRLTLAQNLTTLPVPSSLIKPRGRPARHSCRSTPGHGGPGRSGCRCLDNHPLAISSSFCGMGNMGNKRDRDLPRYRAVILNCPAPSRHSQSIHLVSNWRLWQFLQLVAMAFPLVLLVSQHSVSLSYYWSGNGNTERVQGGSLPVLPDQVPIVVAQALVQIEVHVVEHAHRLVVAALRVEPAHDLAALADRVGVCNVFVTKK